LPPSNCCEVRARPNGSARRWCRSSLFYVVLAPFVGAFADALPKGKVMFISNAIKVIGCLMMLFGSHPLLAYAIVGLGAAAYSPAKYGILTELLPASQLVKANGWIEGLTIASIILGICWAAAGGPCGVQPAAGLRLPADRHRHRHRRPKRPSRC
jgi:LPLT family lysophospholipid transporter-like MFS transporter